MAVAVEESMGVLVRRMGRSFREGLGDPVLLVYTFLYTVISPSISIYFSFMLPQPPSFPMAFVPACLGPPASSSQEPFCTQIVKRQMLSMKCHSLRT
jgi:hypothetical protein